MPVHTTRERRKGLRQAKRVKPKRKMIKKRGRK